MPKYMIHAYPGRMWYVEEFLIPSMEAQGIQRNAIRVWNDTERRGNLRACMAAFADCEGDGGTWHLQDDVLICRDFAQRTAALDSGVVYGFCHPISGDDPALTGTVYAPDMWNGFPCVRIPDPLARECAAWFEAAGKERPELLALVRSGKGDDAVFHTFFELEHGTETARNAAPCLVEHVDWLLDGSTVNEWRGYWCRAAIWDDEALVEELRKALKNRK